MLDRITQLGKGGFHLLVGRCRDLLREFLGKILPVLIGQDRVIGWHGGERRPDHQKNVSLGMEPGVGHALHETRIDLPGTALHLVEMRDVDVVPLVLRERGEVSEGSSEIRAWALMGMNVFLGLRFGVWGDEDPAGHQWTFSETLADVAPEAWGGISVAD